MPPRKKSAAAKGPASIAEDLPLDNKQEAMATIIERLEHLTDKRYFTYSFYLFLLRLLPNYQTSTFNSFA
jgi:hypothetical protein